MLWKSKPTTLEILHQSLIELSKSGFVYFNQTAEQIEKTRYAIMEMEGKSINTDRQAEVMAAAKEKSRTEKELRLLYARREQLQKECAELELRRDELKENLSEALQETE